MDEHWMRRVRSGAGAVLVAALLGSTGPAGATNDGGAAPVMRSTKESGEAREGAGAPDRPGIAPGSYSPPVDAPVVDPFRMPNGPYGAGNRGLEYRTEPGSSVRSIGAGRVAYAGPVAGRLVVSIEHPDGRRSALTGLAVVLTSVGQLVPRGAVVGIAGARLHLGVREHGVYVDPAGLFGPTRRRATLVPVR